MSCDPVNSLSDRTASLNITLNPQSIGNDLNSDYSSLGIYGNLGPQLQGIGGMLGQQQAMQNALGSYPVSNLQQCGPWMPAKTAVGDFLKVQYAENEVRCGITRKMVPAGSPIMLIAGMVISQEAFERWLEENLCAMVCRHQDLHTDMGGYDE